LALDALSGGLRRSKTLSETSLLEAPQAIVNRCRNASRRGKADEFVKKGDRRLQSGAPASRTLDKSLSNRKTRAMAVLITRSFLFWESLERQALHYGLDQ
jgi:hypothetical protein